jgi:hypothetical protein
MRYRGSALALAGAREATIRARRAERVAREEIERRRMEAGMRLQALAWRHWLAGTVPMDHRLRRMLMAGNPSFRHINGEKLAAARRRARASTRCPRGRKPGHRRNE